jgi:hypothetical protein
MAPIFCSIEIRRFTHNHLVMSVMAIFRQLIDIAKLGKLALRFLVFVETFRTDSKTIRFVHFLVSPKSSSERRDAAPSEATANNYVS